MNPSTPGPDVVLVDDEPEDVSWLRDDLQPSVNVELVEPENLRESTLRDGRVFLLDMFLETWPGRHRLIPAARIYDGIALAGVIRAYALEGNRQPPLIALHTGHAGDFSSLPDEIREHALARANNLEWVFLKNGSRSEVPTHKRVLELADAQGRLSGAWPDERGDEQLLEILSGTNEELGNVLDCWPPTREVGRDSGGIAVLRWLLHRILPYPCFLLDERHVAARLGITCAALSEASIAGGKLGEALDACRYVGVLSGFDGQRWWRSRLERMLWELAPGPLPATVDELRAATTARLAPAAAANGVVVLDVDYSPREEVVDVSEAVRIRLDDWPPYAEDAWAAIEDARDDVRLRHRVLPVDRNRLGG